MKKYERLKIGVVGCGYWATNLIKTFEDNNIKNVTIFDNKYSQVKSIKKKFNFVKIGKSFENLINLNLDCIFLITPSSTHFKLARKIINKGQLSILYLKGYEALPASAIVSILLESLFKHRQEIQEEICPFLTIIEEAHNFIPSRSENKDNLPSVDTVRKLISEGRKFGTGIVIISQRPSRLDETIASQCNSQIIFRMVNQKDQRAIRDRSETLDADDSKQLSNLANGQGIISGQVVNFSLPVQIKFDENLLNDDIGNENFISSVENWDDKETVKLRKKFAKDFSNISSSDQRRPN